MLIWLIGIALILLVLEGIRELLRPRGDDNDHD